MNRKWDRMLLQTTEEHFLIKTRCVVFQQTLGNDNKDAMLDCESGFHESEYKRKLNCRKLSVPPGVICTSTAGFTRWTHGQCTRFARACTSGRTNEARDETETKPRESRALQ